MPPNQSSVAATHTAALEASSEDSEPTATRLGPPTVTLCIPASPNTVQEQAPKQTNLEATHLLHGSGFHTKNAKVFRAL